MGPALEKACRLAQENGKRRRDQRIANIPVTEERVRVVVAGYAPHLILGGLPDPSRTIPILKQHRDYVKQFPGMLGDTMIDDADAMILFEERRLADIPRAAE